MKYLFSLIFVLLTSSAFSEEKSQDIVVGKILTIHSKIFNQDKDIWIYVPHHDPRFDFEKPQFPVVYLLDGDDHFESMLAILNKRCNGFLDSYCPKMILVGVTHQDRGRELTPTKSGGLKHPEKMNENGGGGEEFTAYLEKELIPYIDANYPTAPYRTLIGHSLGGLLVINTLTNHNQLFNAYVAIDPSLWWNNEKLLNQTQASLKTNVLDKSSLFLAIANTLPVNMSMKQALKDSSFETQVFRSIFKLKNSLAANTKIHAKSQFYTDENHGSVTLFAQNDALRFIFDFYRVPNDLSYFKEDFDGIPALQSHFAKVSKHLGYQVLSPGELVNGLAYHFLEEKLFSQAFKYFDLNLKNHPQSPHALDSMGNYYLAIGDKPKAIEFFNKALKLGGHSAIQNKLNQLQDK